MPTIAMLAGERINYLSVALRARAAMGTLRSLIDSRQGLLALPNPDLQQDLENVVRSLAARGVARLKERLSSETPLRYEEVQTLEEVAQSFSDKRVVERLQSLVNGGCDHEDMRIAIRLFSAIERRALYHYNDPPWAQLGV